ncbi:MAG TPA: tyrosine-protein phosphatase [Caulobacteraceae bacterium]|nr:tyrosine-protein phosphatase [Caulobacteraceae bacterium]
MHDRVMPLEGIGNFRDFGGYAASDGRRIRRGRLYRSAHHGQATDADLEAIAALNLAAIVDLRRGEERERMPSRRHEAFAGLLIENPTNEAVSDPWIEFIRGSDASADAFRGYLLNYYRNAPFERRHVDLFSRYFNALAEVDGPILIHCAAGKDRTGVLAALTHALLGVGRDDIFEDFLLTNVAARIEERMPMVAQMIAEQSGRTPTDEAVRCAMAVEAIYLEAAFEAIEAAHGGVDAYLREVLGLDASARAAILARLLD